MASTRQGECVTRKKAERLPGQSMKDRGDTQTTIIAMRLKFLMLAACLVFAQPVPVNLSRGDWVRPPMGELKWVAGSCIPIIVKRSIVRKKTRPHSPGGIESRISCSTSFEGRNDRIATR